jgi:serine/threonine-protein kinase RsbW
VSASVVRLVMPAKSEYLILARLALAGIARETPIEESVLADLKLAVTEACGNAVRHAYAGAPGVVEVRFAVEPESIEVVVSDDGDAQRVSARLPAGLPGDDGLAESGMGLAIIEAVVDELDVSPRGGGDNGTVVRMTKRLATPPAADAG